MDVGTDLICNNFSRTSMDVFLSWRAQCVLLHKGQVTGLAERYLLAALNMSSLQEVRSIARSKPSGSSWPPKPIARTKTDWQKLWVRAAET